MIFWFLFEIGVLMVELDVCVRVLGWDFSFWDFLVVGVGNVLKVLGKICLGVVIEIILGVFVVGFVMVLYERIILLNF